MGDVCRVLIDVEEGFLDFLDEELSVWGPGERLNPNVWRSKFNKVYGEVGCRRPDYLGRRYERLSLRFKRLGEVV